MVHKYRGSKEFIHREETHLYQKKKKKVGYVSFYAQSLDYPVISKHVYQIIMIGILNFATLVSGSFSNKAGMGKKDT